ncbi:MAG: arylsulfatase [Pirellulaceae bacterium]|nr:MAG: arylsulfatase [Pirellulaceae bacterium]
MFLTRWFGWALLFFSMFVASRGLADTPRLPNFVIIFTDDQGYADVGCYGAQGFQTPNLDRMARNGVRFTSFYVAQAVCGASRAALLSGCYPNRIGLLGAPNHRATHGIHPDEEILPELLKEKGYATAMFGKWHLGHRPPFLPTRHGFGVYFGLPYSNDMWPFHPETPSFYPPLPLIENERVIAENPDQTQLTTWYTERAVAFIRQNRDRPFFLYVAHAMPHVPLFVSEKFRGHSQQGLYGDVIEEIDWSVGQILQTLQELDLAEHTLVIFTSDNGPWLSYGNHAGSAGPLREGKGTTWEGGVRVPCIMQWPGRIPAGTVCHELAATIDLLPTLVRLAEARLPRRTIDGKDIWPLISGQPGARTPHETYYYYWNRELQAIRSGPWKLHFPHTYRSLDGPPGQDGKPGKYTQKRCGLELYNLEKDIGETNNVAEQHPQIVERLQELAQQARLDLGDSLQGITGKNIRPAGHVTE